LLGTDTMTHNQTEAPSNNPKNDGNNEQTMLCTLILDSNVKRAQALADELKQLKDYCFSITLASNFVEAIKYVSNTLYDCIFCDLSLPNMSEMEVIHELTHHTPGVGIIAMMNTDNHRLVENLLTSGAQDYLIHDDWSSALLSRVIRYVVARQKSHAEIERLAHYDTLTGVANRYLFNDRLSQAVIRAERSGCQVAVLFIDLDHFHGVNEALGYDTGDNLLIEASKRIASCIRKQDTVARLAGDEFAVVLEGIIEPQHVMIITRQILRSFEEPVDIANEPVFLSLSIGISISSNTTLDAQILTKQADIARYRAKEAGRNTFEFFADEYNRMAHHRLSIEQSVNRTLNRIFKQKKD